jgi:hypothetical protein
VTDFPGSLIEFQHCFPDEPACAAYLFAARWPHGFVCPSCGKTKAWELQSKPWTYECAGCGKQTAVTAGTIMLHSKLPLTTWFWAAYLMATHSNGISALQLQRQLALGSYKSAWLLGAKLRRSMLAPRRTPLAGLVEVDETEITCRSKNDPLTGGGGRRRQGKILIVGAVEVQDGGAGPGRIRLKQIPDYSAASLHAFLAAHLAPGATAKTDGFPSPPTLNRTAPGRSGDVIIAQPSCCRGGAAPTRRAKFRRGRAGTRRVAGRVPPWQPRGRRRVAHGATICRAVRSVKSERR